MTNRCKGKEFSAFIRQHVMLSTFGRSAISDKFAKLHNKVTFKVFPALMKPQRPISLSLPQRWKRDSFLWAARGQTPSLALCLPLFPSAPDTHTYNLNFSIYHRFEKSAVNSGLVFKQVKLIKKGVI